MPKLGKIIKFPTPKNDPRGPLAGGGSARQKFLVVIDARSKKAA